ncbi:hypothetical protein MUNTM_09530 [Mycobacterium sp. MUNTM1]
MGLFTQTAGQRDAEAFAEPPVGGFESWELITLGEGHGAGLLWSAGATDDSSFRPTAGGRSGSDPAAGASYYDTLEKTHER